ncbi:hypothetical protein BU24DRAFT_287251 [Aaosphaeria arxii CBS 175.79]|uniref:Uncharacterized protein n=1 Tax=Aaosphaeria arxii CBS 175.79 TaxID=1450172 RepID=A0A6A5XH84_9PLEO|nr:uncharacterized protein BU24DRAFT_287251 [Aaosphaeria arxii CBS 175.79]KAF2011694.1 hypothetical protein BU24DRAFT_287251 [Aaosphaeria arxii CBS 175.79]
MTTVRYALYCMQSLLVGRPTYQPFLFLSRSELVYSLFLAHVIITSTFNLPITRTMVGQLNYPFHAAWERSRHAGEPKFYLSSLPVSLTYN